MKSRMPVISGGWTGIEWASGRVDVAAGQRYYRNAGQVELCQRLHVCNALRALLPHK